MKYATPCTWVEFVIMDKEGGGRIVHLEFWSAAMYVIPVLRHRQTRDMIDLKKKKLRVLLSFSPIKQLSWGSNLAILVHNQLQTGYLIRHTVRCNDSDPHRRLSETSIRRLPRHLVVV